MLSPDGERIVGSDQDGLHCYNASSGSRLWQHLSATPITALTAPATGTTVAAGFADGRILVLFSNGKIGVGRALPSGGAVRHLHTARGAVIASGDGVSAWFWSRKATSPQAVVTTQPVTSLTLSPDAKVAAVAAGEDLVLLEGEAERRLELAARADQLKFSPGAKTLYAALADNTVERVDFATATPLGQSLDLTRPVAALHPDADQILACSTSGSIRRWQQGARATHIPKLAHGGKPLIWAAFAESSADYVTGTLDGRMIFWKPDGTKRLDLSNFQQIPLASADSERVLLYDIDKDVLSVLDTRLMRGGPAIPLDSDPGGSGALADDDPRAVLPLSDGSVALFDTLDGAILHRWNDLYPEAKFDPDALANLQPGEAAFHSHAHISKDGRYAVCAGGARAAHIFQLDPPYRLVELPHAAAVNWITIDLERGLVATGSADNSARVWAFPSGKPLGEPLRHSEGCPDRGIIVKFSSEGSRLVSAGSFDATVRVWDVATGELAIDPLPHSDVVTAIDISADSRRIATGCADGTVRLWDADTGTLISPPWQLGSAILEVIVDPPHGLRLLAHDQRGECAVFEIVPREFNLEPWFLDFAEALAGKKFNARDVLESVPSSDLVAWRERFAAGGADDQSPSSLFAQWLVTPYQRRELTPFRRYWDVGWKWAQPHEVEARRRAGFERATGGAKKNSGDQ